MNEVKKKRWRKALEILGYIISAILGGTASTTLF